MEARYEVPIQSDPEGGAHITIWLPPLDEGLHYVLEDLRYRYRVEPHDLTQRDTSTHDGSPRTEGDA